MRIIPASVRRQPLRVRIMLTFATGAVLLTLTVSLVTYFTVRSVLYDQAVGAATHQTSFTAHLAVDYLGRHPGQSRALLRLLEGHKSFDALIVGPAGSFTTNRGLGPSDVPAALGSRDVPADHVVTTVHGTGQLVYAAPLGATGMTLYLFFPLGDIDQTLSLLAHVLTGVSLAVVLIAIIASQRLAGRILRPLTQVSVAARSIAEGLLDTRIEASSSDEVGLMAASFNRMAAELQELLEKDRRFVANVSHELRTPLAGLQATSELLAARRAEMPPETREAVDLIVEDVVDLRRLVEELMELSAIDSKKAHLRWERIDVLAAVRAIAAKRRLETEVQGPSIETYLDKARLERIVGNLLDNAVEHGEGREITVRLRPANGSFLVQVRDRGPGISPEDMGSLFEPFYKADRSRTRDRGGIGMGLPIARENARLMGGDVTVTSRVGEGATFTVSLPRRETGDGSGAPAGGDRRVGDRAGTFTEP